MMSFDLERFMMSDNEYNIFVPGEDSPDQSLMMGADINENDPFGKGYLASMGGAIGVDNSLSSIPPAGQVLQLWTELQGHTNKVNTVDFSKDGQWMASAGHDKKVIVWGVQDKLARLTLEGHTMQINCVRWSLDNRNMVATASHDSTIRIWDVGTAITDSTQVVKHANKFDCKAQVTAVDFDPERPDIVCSMDGEGELKVWNISTSKCEKTLRLVCISLSFSAFSIFLLLSFYSYSIYSSEYIIITVITVIALCYIFAVFFLLLLSWVDLILKFFIYVYIICKKKK
ncbi:WD40-repeat-containing domain protein, partial [Phycomyces blakesleeanus]